MANHKRSRPKNRRSGCLLCKPHKTNRAKNVRGSRTNQRLRAIEEENYQLEALDKEGT